MNIYLSEVERNLPRILSMFDSDLTSESYGQGDRLYWAWGTSDFPNGTFQGAAHGLSRLWVSNLWPFPTSKNKFIERINSIFLATEKITKKNGSLEEAFPNEGSYCVTALVAFDLLCTLELMQEFLSRDNYGRWKCIIAPLIKYLLTADEKHALISNHLATAAAALVRWYELTHDNLAFSKAKLLIGRIIEGQSEEGWFTEYEGFDAGYQSLATYYLADIYHKRNDLGLEEPLHKSLNFLQYFIHPDGSFGGSFGSRFTRFYAPGGISSLANKFPIAYSICEKMQDSIQHQNVINLSAIDEPNLIPFFNSYCWAATTLEENDKIQKNIDKSQILPSFTRKNFLKIFDEAGLIIKHERELHFLINIKKGGVIYRYNDAEPVEVDCGIVFMDKRNRLGSTHFWNPTVEYTINDDILEIKNSVVTMPKRLPRPIEFIALRLLSLTFFKSYFIREVVKKFLVKLLITKKSIWPVTNIRTISLITGEKIHDHSTMPSGYSRVDEIIEFIPMHMASKGYWQIQDEH